MFCPLVFGLPPPSFREVVTPLQWVQPNPSIFRDESSNPSIFGICCKTPVNIFFFYHEVSEPINQKSRLRPCYQVFRVKGRDINSWRASQIYYFMFFFQSLSNTASISINLLRNYFDQPRSKTKKTIKSLLYKLLPFVEYFISVFDAASPRKIHHLMT